MPDSSPWNTTFILDITRSSQLTSWWLLTSLFWHLRLYTIWPLIKFTTLKAAHRACFLTWASVACTICKARIYARCLHILAQESVVNGDLGVILYAMHLVGEHHFKGEDTEAQGDYRTCSSSWRWSQKSRNANPAFSPLGPVLCEFLASFVSVLILPAPPFPRPYTSAATSPGEIRSSVQSLGSPWRAHP